MGAKAFTITRGDDFEQPFTITLDQSRSLTGTETWAFSVRDGKTGASVLIAKTSPVTSGIRIEASGHATRAFSPTVIFTPACFANIPKGGDKDYVYDLEMTKDGKFETYANDTLTIVGDVTR